MDTQDLEQSRSDFINHISNYNQLSVESCLLKGCNVGEIRFILLLTCEQISEDTSCQVKYSYTKPQRAQSSTFLGWQCHL